MENFKNLLFNLKDDVNQLQVDTLKEVKTRKNTIISSQNIILEGEILKQRQFIDELTNDKQANKNLNLDTYEQLFELQ